MLHGNEVVFLYPTHVQLWDTYDGSSALPVEYKLEIEVAANRLALEYGITDTLEILEFDFEVQP